MSDRYVQVDCFCKHATEKALLVVIKKDEFWIPKSQIGPDSEVTEKDDKGTLEITEWIAEQKGIPY